MEDSAFIKGNEKIKENLDKAKSAHKIDKNEGFTSKAALIIKSCNVEPILVLNMMAVAIVQVLLLFFPTFLLHSFFSLNAIYRAALLILQARAHLFFVSFTSSLGNLAKLASSPGM
jgi:hypothetical protein